MERNLSLEISRIRDAAIQLRNYVVSGGEDEVERYYFEKEFENLVNHDFMNINPDDLIDIYVEYFKGTGQLKVGSTNKPVEFIFFNGNLLAGNYFCYG